ncbi:MAG: hypothetical protein IJA72_04535 [Clostridia bacterium]|nr:hypothetical protein [Clostridia bacterium]
MTRKERLDKIQQVLEESLNLKWVDRIIYNPVTNFYRTADVFDFIDNSTTYAYLENAKRQSFRAQVKLNNEQFIIRMNGMKIDASEHWKELLIGESVDTQTQ